MAALLSLLWRAGRYNEYLRQDSVVLFPKESTFKAYRMFWQKPDVLKCFMNTIFISTVGTALNLFVTVLMAYALSIWWGVNAGRSFA